MGELDILLAKEFSRRHGLYDKKSPHFKDRAYNDNAWKEIAAKLGYNVDILKDRMLQLRNRYNVEKRKYESLCAKYPNSKAQWALYYHLNFLDGHIRPRRQYRTMGSEGGSYSGSLRVHNNYPQVVVPVTPCPPPLVKAPTAQINPVARRRGRPPKKFVYPPEYCNNGDSPKPTPKLQHMGKQDYIQANRSDGEEEINKNEEEDDDETDEVLVKCEVISNDGEEDQENSVGEFINPVSLLAQTASPEEENTENADDAQSAVPDPDEYEHPTQSNNTNHSENAQNGTSSPTSNSPVRIINHTESTVALNAVAAAAAAAAASSKKRRNDELILKLHRSPCKYQAFGQFVAASLSELADDRALNLIEKFTIQIVSSMRENPNPPPADAEE